MAAVKYWFQIGVNHYAFALLCSAAVFCSPGAFADAAASLAEKLTAMGTFAADFSQEVRGDQGQILEQSSGHVRVLRPKFKWVVVAPYAQIIVADEEYLRVFDPDLEQVTLRPIAEALTDTPISLLTQEQVELTQHFAVRAGVAAGAFVLTPLAPDSLYAEIHLTFAGRSLVWLAIVDHLGQLTEIQFTPAPESTVIQSDDFVLTLPPGTDVIGG
jgi:outer membrane lipoprotein carrier protein